MIYGTPLHCTTIEAYVITSHWPPHVGLVQWPQRWWGHGWITYNWDVICCCPLCSSAAPTLCSELWGFLVLSSPPLCHFDTGFCRSDYLFHRSWLGPPGLLQTNLALLSLFSDASEVATAHFPTCLKPTSRYSQFFLSIIWVTSLLGFLPSTPSRQYLEGTLGQSFARSNCSLNSLTEAICFKLNKIS